VLLLDIHHLLGDEIERLVPRHPLELALTPPPKSITKEVREAICSSVR
jgi:hypothetical protein